ncbi:MAG: winged helix-turn-helix transcriptional regulator [Dongiaceae bacterium]
MPTSDATRKLQERRRTWKERFQNPQSYPYRDALDRIGGKWIVLILITLALRPWRFGELKREIPEMSQRVLTQALRDLEMDGMIDRTVYATKPPSVEYSLTPLGRSLLPPLWELINWADTNHDRILAARKRFMQEGK